MKVIKEGIVEKKHKHMGPLLPKKYVGTKVVCYKCKTEFELEAQDIFFIVEHLNFRGNIRASYTDDIVYVKCTYCGYDMYVGKKV